MWLFFGVLFLFMCMFMHIADEFIKMIKNLVNGEEITYENIRGVMIIILSVCLIFYIF